MPIITEGSSADVVLSGNSTLTIQNPSGFATVEFPIGTVVWKGGQANKQLDLNNGTARVTAVTGPVTYYATGDNLIQYIQGSVDPNGTVTLYSTDSNGGQVAIQTASVVRRTPVRIGTFGDSTANTGSTNQDQQIVTAAFPASGATVLDVQAVDKFALPLLYPQALLVANGGISGQTTTQMLGREALAASTSRKAVADIAALGCDVVLLRAGSINDLTGITSAQVATTVASTYANHIKLINRIKSANVLVIDEGIYGFSGTATDPAATRAALVQLNAMFKAYAQTVYNVEFVDPTGVLSDASGAYIPGVFEASGIHLNIWGQYLIAQKEASILGRYFGYSDGVRFPGSNLIPRALMDASTNPGYGQVATGFGVGATNATRQNAKVEVIDGKVWQTCEFTATSAGASMQIGAPYTPEAYGINANDVLGAEFDFFVMGVDGGAPPASTGMNATLDTTKTANGRCVLQGASHSYAANFMGPYRGRTNMPRWRCPEASAAVVSGAGFYLKFSTDDTTKSVKLGMSMPRLVNITQSQIV